MLPLIGAGVMAGMSLLGSAEQNAQAEAQYRENVRNVKKNLEKQYAQLDAQAKEENRNISLEMASQRFKGLALTSTTASTITERAISGNIARRMMNNIEFKHTMTQNALKKAAEDMTASYGDAMAKQQDEAKNAISGARATLAQNSVSTLGAVSGALNAGMAGYSLGSSLGAAQGVGDKSVLSGYKSVLERGVG